MLRRLASLVGISQDFKNNYVKKSYSQCGEDLIVAFICHEAGIEKPRYIDIGAHHPRYINNTYLFYQQGSRGINIEPDPSLFSEFVKQRKEDVNLNVGIGNETGEADFYIMNEPSLNTFMKAEAEHAELENAAHKIRKVQKIKVRTLTDIIKEYNNGVFPEFMTIDVEGLDEQIIRGLNYEGSVPKIMCIETVTYSTKGRGEKKTELIEFVKSKGYLAYADTNINTIFVKESAWRR